MGKGKRLQRNKQNKLKAFLERDNYRCGIHLGGCGQPLTLKDASIDHIIPKAVARRPGTTSNYNECITKKIQADWRKKIKTEPPRWTNLQPMHKKCNNEDKGSLFPPVPIKKHCICCSYIYTQRSACGRERRPIIWGDDQRHDKTTGLVRVMKIRTPKMPPNYLITETPFYSWCHFRRADGSTTMPVCLMLSLLKSGGWQTGWGRGNYVPLGAMIYNNAQHSFDDLRRTIIGHPPMSELRQVETLKAQFFDGGQVTAIHYNKDFMLCGFPKTRLDKKLYIISKSHANHLKFFCPTL